MAVADYRSQGGKLLPALDPSRRDDGKRVGFDTPPHMIFPAQGTQIDMSQADMSLVGLWETRWGQWRQAFEEGVSGRVRRYWDIWRNMDRTPAAGPGQEWRDRTVIPQAFKEIATRVPRLVLGMWGLPENFTINGRGFKDERYEEVIRTLLDLQLDKIGQGDPLGELFIKRIVDAEYYKQIMGHVFFKVFWRKDTRWLKTKFPELDQEGKIIRWVPYEALETVSEGPDLTWLPLSSLAIDVYGKRRWAIERVRTSFEALVAENDRYKEETGQALYPEKALDEIRLQGTGGNVRETMDEPRDTEHWPLDGDSMLAHDPGETPLDMWLCWDNVKGTMTKIANRRVVLDHGIADTPDGLDPYLSCPAIPVPGRPYGESIFHWTQSLYTRQTRIARGRMDQTLMNLFNQYLLRDNTIANTTWFWRPGGLTTLSNANPDRPISDNIYLVPKQQLPPEAYNEEMYSSQQSEAVAMADSVTQGQEGTSKSRDVSAAEINQRVLQGANRYQLEVLMNESTMKRPMLQKMFDLLRMNMTQPELVQILDDQEGEMVDLTKIRRPVDIVVGGSVLDATQAEKMAEIEKVTNLLKDQNFAGVVKHRELLLDLLRATRVLKKNPAKFLKTEEEIASEKQQMAAAEAQAAMGSDPAVAAPGTPPPPSTGPGAAGGAGLASPSGSNGADASNGSGGNVTEI